MIIPPMPPFTMPPQPHSSSSSRMAVSSLVVVVHQRPGDDDGLVISARKFSKLRIDVHAFGPGTSGVRDLIIYSKFCEKAAAFVRAELSIVVGYNGRLLKTSQIVVFYASGKSVVWKMARYDTLPSTMMHSDFMVFVDWFQRKPRLPSGYELSLGDDGLLRLSLSVGTAANDDGVRDL